MTEIKDLPRFDDGDLGGNLMLYRETEWYGGVAQTNSVADLLKGLLKFQWGISPIYLQ